MLDVYVTDSTAVRDIAGAPAFSFSESVHSAIFYDAGIDVYSKFAFLRRMYDYYADSNYSGDSLLRVMDDIDRLTPLIETHTAACDALASFRRVCSDAHAAGKTVLLVCD